MKYFITSLIFISASLYCSFLIYLTMQNKIREDEVWFDNFNLKIDSLLETRKQHKNEMDCLDAYWQWRSDEINK